METSIRLQGPFSYSLVPIFLAFLLFLITLLIYISIRISQRDKKPKQQSKEQPKEQPVPVAKNGNTIKESYKRRLDLLEQKFDSDEIEEREFYQKLSSEVRQFAFEMTGRRVTTMTLTEIQRANMPQLKVLIEEYYEPEFAKDSEMDAKGALKRTRRVIEEWN